MGTGKANQGVTRDLPCGSGALEELSQLEAPLPDVTASSGQPGSSADTLRGEGRHRAWRPYIRAP